MSIATGLIARSGLELLTMQTPNGYKISIMLEELKAAYGREYTAQSIDIMKNVQKEAWFTAHGSNGRIPVLVDHDKGISVQEGGAILSYLARNYDPEHKFSFTSDPELSRCEQWMYWVQSGLGPMQGELKQTFQCTASARLGRVSRTG
jgi:glutathione S-transferase